MIMAIERQRNRQKKRNKISCSLMIAALTLSFTEIRYVAIADPFEDSMAAYDRGDYATTLQLFGPLAERGMHKPRMVLVRCIAMEKVFLGISRKQ